ncbi:MAG: helix-turn-helix domain-containing protein, partial [Promethearchaeota archaeon]
MAKDRERVEALKLLDEGVSVTEVARRVQVSRRSVYNWRAQEKEEEQKRGYMYEHLLCLYSSAGYRTALYNETYP